METICSMDCMTMLMDPPLLVENDRFLIKIAENEYEIKAAQTLRFDVFKSEQGRLENIGGRNRIDVDEFDRYCLHLLVIDKEKNNIVGTYRMHPGTIAMNGIGFYSSIEYKIENLESIALDAIEMGRSCVAMEYRNGTVVGMLWNGIAEIQKRSNARYLFGCVSLENTDPFVGWGLYHYLVKHYGISDILRAKPRQKYLLPKNDGYLTDEFLLKRELPPLFKGYLRLGVKICGEPVLDREFGSVDFLILLDFETVPDKYKKHYHLD